MMLHIPTIDRHTGAQIAREDQAAEALLSDAAEVARCRSRIAWVRSVGGLAGADMLPGGRAHR